MKPGPTDQLEIPTVQIDKKPAPTDQLEIPTMQIQAGSSSRAQSLEDTLVRTDSDPDIGVAEVNCPRCGSKLINPESLGWCRSCGYCSSLEAERAKAVLPSAPVRGTSTLGAVEFFQMLQKVPRWFWILLSGSIVVVLVSIAADWMWLEDEEFERALWTSFQLGGGWLVLLIAQMWVLLQMAPNDDRLGPRDFIVPFRLWNLAFKRLPDTRRPVWLGTWSMTAMVCAVAVVGGLDYWYQFYKPKKVANKNLMSAVLALAETEDKNKSLTESIKDFANSQDLNAKKAKPKPQKKEKGDRRPTVQCVILGYIPATEAVPFTLLVAAAHDDKLLFGGPVRDGLTQKVVKELIKRFEGLEQPQPVAAFRHVQFLGAVWLKPEVFCEIHQDGFDRDGVLLKPNFKALLKQ